MQKIRSGNHTLNTEPIGSFRTTHLGVYFLTFRMTGQQLEVGGGGTGANRGWVSKFHAGKFLQGYSHSFLLFQNI